MQEVQVQQFPVVLVALSFLEVCSVRRSNKLYMPVVIRYSDLYDYFHNNNTVLRNSTCVLITFIASCGD